MNDLAYDVITVLQNKLQGLAAYEHFLKDAVTAGHADLAKLIESIRADDQKHVAELTKALETLAKEGRLK